MKKIFDLIVFFVPYAMYRKEGPGEETLVFVKCVLLITANVVTLIILYAILARVLIPIPDISRAQAKLAGLLSLVPFALFYWFFRGRYKRKFAEYDKLSSDELQKLTRYSNAYIYATLILIILFSVGPMLWKLGQQSGVFSK